MIGEDAAEFPRAHLPHRTVVAEEAFESRVVEEHHVAIGRHLAVCLDVVDTGGVSDGERRRCVLPDAGILARRGDQTAVSEDSGMPCLREVRVRHAPGRVLLGPPWPGFGVKALPMPLRASVSSLGMIHSLLDWPSLIFGSI